MIGGSVGLKKYQALNCQEKSQEELLETLRETLKEALEMNKNEAPYYCKIKLY